MSPAEPDEESNSPPPYQEPPFEHGNPSLLENPNALTSMTSVPVVTSVPRPAYLVPLALPGYGTQITRIAGDVGTTMANIGTVNGVATGKWGRWTMHHYSKDQPWNDDMSMIWLEQRSQVGVYASPNPTKVILDARTYTPIIGNRGTSNNHPWLDAAYEVRWRPAYPTQMVSWTRSNQTLRVFDILSQALVYQVSVPSPDADGFGFLSEGTLSNDGRYVCLASAWPDPQVSGNEDHFCVVDLEAGIAGTHYPNAASTGPGVGPMAISELPSGMPTTAGKAQQDWCSISPLGTYVITKHGEEPEYHRCWDVNPATLACTTRTLDNADHPLRMAEARGRLDGFMACMSHADFQLSDSPTLTGSSVEVIVGGVRWLGSTSAPLSDWCSSNDKKALGTVIAVSMETGTHVHISRGTTALPGKVEAPDQHCSGRCYQKPNYMLVTYEYNVNANTGILNHLSDELVFYETRSNGVGIRCGTTRTDDATGDDKQKYRGEAHGVPSPDGSKIMFTSNWQRQANPPFPDWEDYKVYVLDVPPGAGANDPEPLVHDEAVEG